MTHTAAQCQADLEDLLGNHNLYAPDKYPMAVGIARDAIKALEEAEKRTNDAVTETATHLLGLVNRRNEMISELEQRLEVETARLDAMILSGCHTAHRFGTENWWLIDAVGHDQPREYRTARDAIDAMMKEG